MKTKAMSTLVFVFFAMAFAFLPVSALGAMAATPSPTFIPPSITPTPYLYDCPVGTPLGWGTYTPSPLWLSTCGSCASLPTSTLEPTGTLNPLTATAQYLTGTPTPTTTGTPTGTPEILATPTLQGAAFDFDAQYLTRNGLVTPLVSELSCTPIAGTDGIRTVTCTGSFATIDNGWNSEIGHTQTFIGMANHLNPSGEALLYWNATLSNLTNVESYRFRLNGGDVPLVGTANPYLDINFEFTFESGTSFVGTYSGDITITYSTEPIFVSTTATPTVTPTTIPYVTTYCSSVAPQFDEFGFELFQPDGAPNCSIGWDSFGVGDYTMPAAQICLQPSKFGVIRLFAVDFEVGVYGLVAAAAFFYRFFRTA